MTCGVALAFNGPKPCTSATLVRALACVGLLIGLAALNLLLNFFVPNGFKLVLVPVFAIGVVAVVATLFRRTG